MRNRLVSAKVRPVPSPEDELGAHREKKKGFHRGALKEGNRRPARRAERRKGKKKKKDS